MTVSHLTNPLSSSARRFTAVLAGGVFVVGAVIVAAWGLGTPERLRFGDDPVAPGPLAGLLAMLVGAGAVLQARGARNGWWVSRALGAGALLLAVGAGAARGLGLPPLDEWTLSLFGAQVPFPDGRFDPIAAVFWAIHGGVLAFPQVSRRARQAAAYLELFPLAAGALMAQATLLGAPTMAGTQQIPGSLLGALMHLWLGLGLLRLLGDDCWPLRAVIVDGTLRPARRGVPALGLFAALFLLTSAVYWFLGVRAREYAHIERTLGGLAELQVQTIAEWRRDRRAMAEAAVAGVGPAAVTPAWLAEVRRSGAWDAAVAVRADGQRVEPADNRAIVDDALEPALEGLRRTGRATVGDVLPTARGDLVLVTAPLQGGGALVLAADVSHALRPLLREITMGAAPVRFALTGGAAGGWRLAPEPSEPSDPLHVIERPVPGSGWRLEAGMSVRAVEGPLRNLAIRAIALELILLTALGALVYALWYRRDLLAASRELLLVRAREQSAESLRRADRVLRIRSAVNVAIARGTDEATLLQEICDLALDPGGYRMAWIGFREEEPQRIVRPAACAGLELALLATQPAYWSDDARGTGPSGRAIRSGQLQVVTDLSTEPTLVRMRMAVPELQFAAMCAIPLTTSEGVVGIFGLFAPEAVAFDAAEVALLGELGADISFGLDALRTRQRAQRAQERATLFREAIEHLSDAMYLADATGRIIDFNDAGRRDLGYTAEELLQLTALDIAPIEERVGSFAGEMQDIRGTSGTVLRTAHRRKDGTTFPVEVTRSLIDFEGETFIIAIARDVSDRMRADAERADLQEQLLRAQRMESVGRLAGGVAHDFNNLLTVINTTAELALGEVPADAPLHHDLEEIRGAGQRAAALTRQLLAFSRQQVMRREVVDVNALIRQFGGLVRRVIGEDVQFETILADEAPPVYADPGQLEQVLMNLCVNARDAMPGGGRLVVRTAPATLTADDARAHRGMAAGDFLKLSVEDTGHGIPADVQERIFEPFFTTKAPGQGTGLGLSTVYGIVKQTGGSIWLDSAPGRGTRFDVYLPVAQLEGDVDVAGTTTAAAEPAGGGETILVVEDEEAIRHVVRRVLVRHGYLVVEAGTGEEALERLAGHPGPVHLVLTDLIMPGMTGTDLAVRLRATHPDLPVLLGSGYSAEALADRLAEVPGTMLIPKPYAIQDLLRAVREGLARQAQGAGRG